MPTAAAIRRLLARHIEGVELASHSDPPLERVAGMEDTPRLLDCQSLEAPGAASRNVGNPQPALAAFLDGTQRSEKIAYRHGVPIVLGTVGAVVRVRSAKGTVTWRMVKEMLICAPLSLVGPSLRGFLGQTVPVVDTESATNGDAASAIRHPDEAARRALHLVQGARERIEKSLAEQWLAERPEEPLLVDGSISRIVSGAEKRLIIGLVKSHRTLYQTGGDVAHVLSLHQGTRSRAFLVESRNGPVASWYLRLRREEGRDPLHGLVRVEIPQATFSAERADAASRWILAETAPASLPDARWDRLLYGVRDCEMFLAAVV